MDVDKAEFVRDEIGRFEGRIDREVADKEVRRRLWRACDDAMAWSWESVGMAQEKLLPVRNHFEGG